MIARVKIMCDLDISERRKPQDGKINFAKFSPQHKLELRVATVPTNNGLEDVVIRILASAKPIPLDRLGISNDNLARLKAAVERPYGMVLCVGPTGSGKTTTLHSALSHINVPERKIWTAEDQVEITQPGLRQVQVNPRIEWTFAKALRAFLRADPDVIMVGEIRDRETADIAIRSALTGHLVFSTLHTNDAPSAITRLTDMGVENYLITSSLVSVLAQRLVRLICPHCKIEAGTRIAPDGEKVEAFRGAGCDNCSQTGYTSRVGIFELMELNDEIRKLIMANGDASEITVAARRNGMQSLREDGWNKVRLGITTADEVMRVTQEF
jgi:type II secretory ATPase GspE/PulE/Tfp pilus assembly ATPase PilB-like protein